VWQVDDEDDEDVAFFAVYDGHGGKETSLFLKHNLHLHILNQLKNRNNRNDVHSSILQGCKSCDMCCGETSGSTAVLCLATRNTLWFANVGDSEAILSVHGKAVPMSKRHRPCECNQAGSKCQCPEKLRIEEAGGFVMRKRIMGLLAVSRYGCFLCIFHVQHIVEHIFLSRLLCRYRMRSERKTFLWFWFFFFCSFFRAFGDVDSKPTHPNSTLGTYGGRYTGDFVISTPYITSQPITESTEFVVLACDGLFDVMTYVTSVCMLHVGGIRDFPSRSQVSKYRACTEAFVVLLFDLCLSP
jgi:serine/threonine protein phosphatase PrpC